MKYSHHNIALFFYIATFCAAYIDAPFLLAGILVPSFFVLIFAFPFILMTSKSLLKNPELKHIGMLATFLIFSAILFGEISNITEKLKGLLQISTALVISFATYSYLSKKPLILIKTSSYCIFFIVLFSATEVLGLTKELSDSLRSFFFPEDLVTYLYISSERDLALAGFERPKVFTAEPSYVAIIFFAMSVISIKLTPKPKTFLLLTLSTLAMIYLYRSPIIYSTLIIITYIYFLEDKLLGIGPAAAISLIITTLIAAWVFPYLLEWLGRPLLTGEINAFSADTLNSQSIRFLVPIHTLGDVLKSYPLFGVGLTGKETIESISSLRAPAQLAMGTNNFFTIIMYFGAAGTLIYLLVFLKLLKGATNKYMFTALPCIFIYTNMLGGYETIKYWLFMFMILAAYKITAQRNMPVKNI